jgi:RNA polymerase sigma-70 factor (ECF subfamily)
VIRFFPALARFAQDATTDAASAERDWVLRAQDGDSRAFRALFDRHAPSVHRFLRDLLGDPAGAEEATQETFVRAFHHLRALRAGDRFRPWILGIARNVFREQCRRRRRQALWCEPQQADEGQEAAKAEPLHGHDPVTPESLLLSREETSRLTAALQTLTDDRRAVLLLRFDHGLPCAEVATLLGWSVPKVKVEVHRARAQLRAALASAGGEVAP